MAESKTEARVRELEKSKEGSVVEVAYLKTLLEEQRRSFTECERLIYDLRQQNSLLQQKLEEQVRRIEKWDARFWGLIIVLFSAVLSLSSGLVVLLNRK